MAASWQAYGSGWKAPDLLSFSSIAPIRDGSHGLPDALTRYMIPSLSQDELKQLLKDALVEVLEERRDLVYDVFAEVLEDMALVEAIQERQQGEAFVRGKAFGAIEGQA